MVNAIFCSQVFYTFTIMKSFNYLMLLFFSIFLMAQQGFAQFETSKKKTTFIKAIPIKTPQAKKKAIVKVEKPTSSIEAKIDFKSTYDQDKNNPFKKFLNTPQVAAQPEERPNDVRNPSEIYTQKMNQKNRGESNQPFMSDTYLGEFKTGSRIVKIACRDHEAPDGDLVRIWVNDRVVVESLLLDVQYRELLLELQPGFNKIEFEALNQGESGPNTAQFVVFDSAGKPITVNKWNLSTGVKAKVILVKEEVER